MSPFAKTNGECSTLTNYYTFHTVLSVPMEHMPHSPGSAETSMCSRCPSIDSDPTAASSTVHQKKTVVNKSDDYDRGHQRNKEKRK